VELARLLTHLDLHTYQFLEHMYMYNTSDYAEMCEEPCLEKGYHIWTELAHAFLWEYS
jgi:hypothetical protein